MILSSEDNRSCMHGTHESASYRKKSVRLFLLFWISISIFKVLVHIQMLIKAYNLDKLWKKKHKDYQFLFPFDIFFMQKIIGSKHSGREWSRKCVQWRSRSWEIYLKNNFRSLCLPQYRILRSLIFDWKPISLAWVIMEWLCARTLTHKAGSPWPPNTPNRRSLNSEFIRKFGAACSGRGFNVNILPVNVHICI